MFGLIDLFTLATLVGFYFTQKQLSKVVKRTLLRIIYLSSITLAVTFFSILINNVDKANALTSSFIDITTDIITFMKIFTLTIGIHNGNTARSQELKFKPVAAAALAATKSHDNILESKSTQPEVSQKLSEKETVEV
eukprot:Awhi_evm1s223